MSFSWLYRHMTRVTDFIVGDRTGTNGGKDEANDQLSNMLVRLPVEVVAIVFVFAAIDDRRTAHSLARVSRLTRSWTKHILYRTVVLTTLDALTVFTEAVASNPILGQHVQSLWIGSKIFHLENTSTGFYPAPPAPGRFDWVGDFLPAVSKYGSSRSRYWYELEEKAMQGTMILLSLCPNLRSLALLEEAPAGVFDSSNPPSLPFQLIEITSQCGVPPKMSGEWEKAFRTIRRIYWTQSPTFSTGLSPDVIEELEFLQSIEIYICNQQYLAYFWVSRQLRRFLHSSVGSVIIRADETTARSGILNSFLAIDNRVKLVGNLKDVDEENCSCIFDDWLVRTRQFV